MSALAIVLKQLGNEVSGSDYKDYMFTEDELVKNNIGIQNYFSEFCMKGKLKQKLKMWAIFGVLILVACVGVSFRLQ